MPDAPDVEWSAHKLQIYKALEMWVRSAKTHAIVRNIYAQYKWAGEKGWERIAGTFKIHLRFCLRQLGMHDALGDAPEAELRWASGLRASGKTAEEAGVTTKARVLLIYMNKTEAEREAAEGKARGKDKKDKETAKDKGQEQRQD